jgi:hypothetical protein
MMVKSAQPGEGGGPPFTLSTIMSKVVVTLHKLIGQTHSPISPLSLYCMYSVAIAPVGLKLWDPGEYFLMPYEI